MVNNLNEFYCMNKEICHSDIASLYPQVNIIRHIEKKHGQDIIHVVGKLEDLIQDLTYKDTDGNQYYEDL